MSPNSTRSLIQWTYLENACQQSLGIFAGNGGVIEQSGLVHLKLLTCLLEEKQVLPGLSILVASLGLSDILVIGRESLGVELLYKGTKDLEAGEAMILGSVQTVM